jgi:hypothetical protein
VADGSPPHLPAVNATVGHTQTPQSRRTALARASRGEAEGIVTELGGGFYLVNVLAGLAPPRTLSRWALLEAFIQALLPTAALAEDLLWILLRELDHRPTDRPSPGENATWIAEQLPAIRPRLLAVATASLPASPVGPEFDFAGLLLHRARVLVTRSRVDLLFRLDQIALPIRRAGLDRDPGWLPDFGRVIRFHFQ